MRAGSEARAVEIDIDVFRPVDRRDEASSQGLDQLRTLREGDVTSPS